MAVLRNMNVSADEELVFESADPLPRRFYYGDCVQKSKELLGKILVHKTVEGITAGIIVETEAYLGESDPACHASAGRTLRTEPFYGKPGVGYVFVIYGIHYCFNVITRNRQGECILIRALEPISGFDLMYKRRPSDKMALTNGPAKLTQAMGINVHHSGLDLTGSRIVIVDYPTSKFDIIQTTRIGISKAKDWPLRFYIKNNPFASKSEKHLCNAQK